jgi:hypothetical protein
VPDHAGVQFLANPQFLHTMLRKNDYDGLAITDAFLEYLFYKAISWLYFPLV